MVALSAVKLKRKTPPVGIETWTKEAVQERLLEVVKQKNVDVEVTISIALYPKWKSLIQGVVAYLDHLPDGINAEISLQCLDKGKRWLQLLLQPQEWRQDGTTETTQWNDQALTNLLLLLGIDKVSLNSRISLNARRHVCATESFPTASRSIWTGALKRQRTTCIWLPSEISPEFFDFCSTVPGLQCAWRPMKEMI